MTKLCPRKVCMAEMCPRKGYRQMCPRKGYMTKCVLGRTIWLKCVLGRAIHIIEADNCQRKMYVYTFIIQFILLGKEDINS